MSWAMIDYILIKPSLSWKCYRSEKHLRPLLLSRTANRRTHCGSLCLTACGFLQLLSITGDYHISCYQPRERSKSKTQSMISWDRGEQNFTKLRLASPSLCSWGWLWTSEPPPPRSWDYSHAWPHPGGWSVVSVEWLSFLYPPKGKH